MDLAEASVVITGASSGIGRATALAFADAGSNLTLVARGGPALDDTAGECVERGVRAFVAPVDVADEHAVARMADAAVERFGGIDVWVNNAAVSLFGPSDEVPFDEVSRVIDVNLLGCLAGTRAATRHMRQRGSGVIINVSSVVGTTPQPYTQAYCLSKAAVRSLTASLRQELRLEGARDIHAVSVLPASIDTPLFQRAANHTGRRVLAMRPAYAPERVADAIVKSARRPRREIIVGGAGRWLVWLGRAFPGLAERGMARAVDRSHLSREERAAATEGNLNQPLSGDGETHGGWRRESAIRPRIALAAGAAGVSLAGAALAMRRAA